MATYTEMVQMVLDWSNRDKEVLPYNRIKTFLDFAADNVYRNLRIVPLENVTTYNISIDSDDTRTYNQLTVPGDAIEFISLRKKDANSLTGYTVYDAKPDVRAFYNEYAGKYDFHYYTREQNSILVHPPLRNGEEYELYYYRRLPAPDARYIPDTDDTDNLGNFWVDTDSVSALDLEINPEIARSLTTIRRNNGTSFRVYGSAPPNWLMDENERLLLFGALAEAFTYLDDNEMAQKYGARFAEELQQLENEENRRQYAGGDIQVHYQTGLI